MRGLEAALAALMVLILWPAVAAAALIASSLGHPPMPGVLWAACSRWLMHDYERQRDRALVLGIGAVALPLIYIHQKEYQ